MRIRNQYSFHLNKWVRYFTKEEAYDYRNKIQKLIDEEDLNDILMVDFTKYDEDCYGVYLRSSYNAGMESKADVYIRYNDAIFKMKHILDAVGLSDKIES